MEITTWNRIQAFALSNYAALAWRTSSYKVHGMDHFESARASGRPLIFSTWHGMTMIFGGYLLGQQGHNLDFVLMTPDDHRGAVLTVWGHKLGTEPFAISMEADSMVAARRLLTLIRKMTNEGKSLALNPDGPDGPTHVPKDGVFFVAQKSKALIVPSAAYTKTCYHIPRWDRYVVPFPFSRTTVVFGEPFEIPPGELTDGVRNDLIERLNEAELAAERIHLQGTPA